MPKMEISRLMFYSTVLTSVMLSSCSQHAQTHSALENTASNYAQKAATYWTEQQFCSGRYQINLPSNRISGTGWLRYNGWQIIVRPDYWNLEVESVLEVKEKGYNGNESFIENRIIIPNKAIAMATQAPGSWEHSVSKHLKGMIYYVYFYFKLGKNDAYSIKTLSSIMPVNGKAPPNLKQLEKSKVDEAIGLIRNNFFDKLRDRKDTEMPQQQGVCLTEGFIADKGRQCGHQNQRLSRRLCRANDGWLFGGR